MKDPTYQSTLEGGTRLARGKSLDPKHIQAFEQEAFSIITSLNAQASHDDKSAYTDNELNVFSMENYESEEDKKAAESANKSSKCCCSVKPVHPRHIAPQSKYSVCIFYKIQFQKKLKKKRNEK